MVAAGFIALVYFCPMLDAALTKRQLGLVLLLLGSLGFVGILAIDLLDVGREGGIGPAQQIALALMLGAVLVGLTLLPLKDRPA